MTTKKHYKNDDMSGIYQIHCILNNKSYIGQAYHIWHRLRHEHFRTLLKNTNPNRHLQAAFNKYGMENFIWSVYKLCAVEELNDEETLAIATIGRENLFNFTDGGEGLKGFKHEPPTKIKNRALSAERWASGKYDIPSMAIKRINVFTGDIHHYARSGLAKVDGFSGDLIKQCIWRDKKTHKGFFWLKADDETSYDTLKNNLNKLNMHNTETYRTFALQLDGHPIEDIFVPQHVAKIKLTNSSRKYKQLERIDMVTGIVKEYMSIADAARDGFDRSTIQRAIKGEYNSYRGYFWQLI